MKKKRWRQFNFGVLDDGLEVVHGMAEEALNESSNLSNRGRVKGLMGTGLNKWLYAVSQAKRNGTKLNVVCSLDSLTANTGYVDNLRSLLQSSLGDGGLGYMAATSPAVAAEFGNTSPFGNNGGTTNTNANFDPATDDIYDPNLYSMNYASNGYMNLIDNLHKFDRADVYFLKQPSGGSFLWGSGLSATTIADMVSVNTADTAKSIGKATYSKFGPSFGGGHMQAKSIVAPVRLLGVDLHNGPAGVRVHRLAQGGTQTRQVAQLDGAQYTNFLKSIGCDLFILNCGMNDTGQTDSVFETDVRTILTRVRAANPNCAILLLFMNDTNLPSKNVTLELFRKKLLGIAVDYNALILDTRWIIGNFETANAKGMMTDGTHPNAQTMRSVGEAVFNFIGGKELGNIDEVLLS